MSENKRERLTVWLSKETISKCDSMVALQSSKNRSHMIERAIEFYAGYVSAQTYTGFFL